MRISQRQVKRQRALERRELQSRARRVEEEQGFRAFLARTQSRPVYAAPGVRLVRRTLVVSECWGLEWRRDWDHGPADDWHRDVFRDQDDFAAAGSGAPISRRLAYQVILREIERQAWEWASQRYPKPLPGRPIYSLLPSLETTSAIAREVLLSAEAGTTCAIGRAS